MKKLFVTIVVLFILAGCSSLTSQSTPTPTATPTPIPLSDIDLEPILIQSGDLPAGYSGSQVKSSNNLNIHLRGEDETIRT